MDMGVHMLFLFVFCTKTDVIFRHITHLFKIDFIVNIVLIFKGCAFCLSHQKRHEKYKLLGGTSYAKEDCRRSEHKSV